MVVKTSLQSVRVLLLLSLFILICQNVNAQSSGKWRIKNRLQASYEFDDNIRENTADSLKKNDSSLRFIFHSRASRSGANTRLAFSYQGGLQSYFRHSIENKLINEVQFSGQYRLNKLVAGVRGNGRLKIYLNHTFDYSTGSFELFFRLPPISNVFNEFAVNTAGLEYQNFPGFNYSEKQLKWTISKKLSSGLTGVLELSGKSIDYDRNIVITTEDSTDFPDIQQKDDNYKLQFKLNYTKSVLVNFSYSLQHNDSNSPGYNYTRHQFVLIVGVPLSSKTWLRGYAAAQIKVYPEEVLPIFPTDVDTEREESNFFVLDISRDLSPSLSALLRFAYYNNESVIRSRFYRKAILTAGFDFRF
ncbi:hypothetical protein IH785_15455 [candidate division KSB1 bacterium]|nr:hypothetical protein [candidate division KSB1 bacterium]